MILKSDYTVSIGFDKAKTVDRAKKMALERIKTDDTYWDGRGDRTVYDKYEVKKVGRMGDHYVITVEGSSIK
jgi:hypothetical protein